MINKKQKESLQELIIFSIYLLELKKEKPDFENILEKCFKLFPESFSFSKNSQWPDSRKVDRPLRSLRKEKIISGNPESFSLTEKGKKIALDINKKFKQNKLF